MKTLLLLLLMTGVCWAEKEKSIYPLFRNLHDNTILINCPDGYHLEGKLWNRKCSTETLCIDDDFNNTDAYLKCVKE